MSSNQEKTKIAVEVFDKHAIKYQQKFLDFDLYNDSFDLFCLNIKQPEAHILELACGPGNITKYLLSKRPDFKLVGIDLSPNMIRLATANNPDADFRIMDCKTISSFNQKFNGIICGFALPYLSKEEVIQLIKDSAGLLFQDGILYVSTMEDDYEKSGWQLSSAGEKVYQYFYEEKQLTTTLIEQGFEVIHLDRKKYQSDKGAEIVDLIIMARRIA